MKECLLTVDWDYFVNVNDFEYVSYRENERNILEEWYRRYLKYDSENKNLESCYYLSEEYLNFWNCLKQHLILAEPTPVIITESHEDAYLVALNYHCESVCSFDAHSDLGYGGLESLEFEINCANWLGKLLKDERIKEAGIVYSKYTKESIQDFLDITERYPVQFYTLEALFKEEIEVKAIHICRSGPWTPPWYDNHFKQFIDEITTHPNNYIEEIRHWEPNNLSLAEQINCLLGII